MNEMKSIKCNDLSECASVNDIMQFIKQPVSIPIRNIELRSHKKNINFRRHGSLLPNSIRCLICGPSNCGKTNLIISLLEDPNGLCFANIYLYSMSLYQPKYVYLGNLLKQIDEIGLYMFSSNEDVIPPEKAKPYSVFIFDDVITQKQNNIKSYFCMGRHNNIDSFYLTQSYAHVPKHLIRENANLLIIFKQDIMNLKHIFNDYGLSTDLNFELFQQICKKCWEEKYGFLVLDLERSVDGGKYRKCFSHVIKITKDNSLK